MNDKKSSEEEFGEESFNEEFDFGEDKHGHEDVTTPPPSQPSGKGSNKMGPLLVFVLGIAIVGYLGYRYYQGFKGGFAQQQAAPIVSKKNATSPQTSTSQPSPSQTSASQSPGSQATVSQKKPGLALEAPKQSELGSATGKTQAKSTETKPVETKTAEIKPAQATLPAAAETTTPTQVTTPASAVTQTSTQPTTPSTQTQTPATATTPTATATATPTATISAPSTPEAAAAATAAAAASLANKKPNPTIEELQKDLFSEKPKTEVKAETPKITVPASISSGAPESKTTTPVPPITAPAAAPGTATTSTPVPAIQTPAAIQTPQAPIGQPSTTSTEGGPQVQQIKDATEALNKLNQQLNQQMESNLSQMKNLDAYTRDIAQTVGKLNSEISAMDNRILALTNTANSLSKDVGNIRTDVSRKGGAASIEELTVTSGPIITRKQPVPPPTVLVEEPEYVVHAVIPGRAWLKSSRGQIVTVTEGDNLGNYGKILVIDASNGVVLTTSGVTFH